MLREKVTKLAKIMFTGLTMALCVTALNPAVTAKAEDMLQWERHVEGNIQFFEYSGNHFFLKEHEKEIAKNILEAIY